MKFATRKSTFQSVEGLKIKSTALLIFFFIIVVVVSCISADCETGTGAHTEKNEYLFLSLHGLMQTETYKN